MDKKKQQVCQIIGGSIGNLEARQKNNQIIELGELLISHIDENQYAVYQVNDVSYSTQMEQKTIELMSGMHLENQTDEEIAFFDKDLRSYNIVNMKNLAIIEKKNKKFKVKAPKTLPDFFSNIYRISEDELFFLEKPQIPLYFGKLRSGSTVFEKDVYLDANEVLSHHILFCATTGKGKSNFLKNILWHNIGVESNGILVLDAHDEYFGRGAKKGLKNHDDFSQNAIYYTNFKAPFGSKTFYINIADIRPSHFEGSGNFSDAQKEAMRFYYQLFDKKWIPEIFNDDNIEAYQEVQKGTILVLRRKFSRILSCQKGEKGTLVFKDIFSDTKGERTIKDIADELESGKTVVLDCSHFSGSIEMLIGSMIMETMFYRYKNYSKTGELDNKPVVSVVIEEAPRVIGKDVLAKGSNIFGTIAREGRKFKIGLIAITQLPSLIPREILANMNTKVIMGVEMAQEREAIISTTSQDLSEDSKNIASLNKGEAIISSTFVPFAVPIYCPLFETNVDEKEVSKIRKSVFGM